MIYTKLGRTGIAVSKAGLGGGGHSRLGLSRGLTNGEASKLVAEAVDLGVNYFDTAEGYGTEGAVGLGIRLTAREKVVISTKLGVRKDKEFDSPESFRKRVEGCLRRLNTDYIDVLSLHGIDPEEYDYAKQELLPTLFTLKEEGKVRHLGLTERFIYDTTHTTLQKALADDFWDVYMVGFNLLNQSARSLIFEQTKPRGIAIQLMFAVRKALSQPEALIALTKDLAAQGHDFGDGFRSEDPLGWLIQEGYAETIAEAAYRYCAHEPGVDVVLFGTGSQEHLRENVKSICLPPLPVKAKTRLDRMFFGVDSVSGN